MANSNRRRPILLINTITVLVQDNNLSLRFNEKEVQDAIDIYNKESGKNTKIDIMKSSESEITEHSCCWVHSKLLTTFAQKLSHVFLQFEKHNQLVHMHNRYHFLADLHIRLYYSVDRSALLSRACFSINKSFTLTGIYLKNTLFSVKRVVSSVKFYFNVCYFSY